MLNRPNLPLTAMPSSGFFARALRGAMDQEEPLSWQRQVNWIGPHRSRCLPDALLDAAF